MIVNVSMVPIGKGESLSGDVAKVIEIVEAGGLPYKLHPMGTIIEGEWDEVMSLIKRCQMKLRETSRRVYTTIVIDDREGAQNSITAKIASVEKALGRPVNK